ncbi:MAG: ATP-dependent metallopeptidase FtsH/Yme1/Tma family protein, partial [Lachnospiraceae bacterium]|nr:ATP-dependent metallopeptidase FtsH/Yme1/Tma family protein [Lachnospiraceae bacterium]
MDMSKLNIIEKYDGSGAPGEQGGGGGDSPRPGGSGSSGGENPKRQNIIMFMTATLITLVMVNSLMRMVSSSTTKEIPYSEFVKMLEGGKVVSVLIKSDRIEITPTASAAPDQQSSIYGQPTTITYYTGKVETDDTLTARLIEKNVEINGQVTDTSQVLLSFLLFNVVPILLMFALISFLFRRMTRGGNNPFSVGKSTAKVYVQKETGITFQDVAGEDEAKESLQEV